ncbi:hypothetical protein [Rhodanobacter sp. C03]|uniref:hypothetical protein n=1 Tax=Rhodanobacter sp. C03 TaxID=1945858 RepID=UPI00098486D0|nr:hypothetical protein [Rhodanobacter sp. C03]OOG58368.1 hypothetical protein B0E48_06155 [Rhodanobacter sp. C03]
MAGLLLLLGLVTGCASIAAPTYQPSVDTTQVLLEHREARLAVGPFVASVGVPNTGLSVRGNQLSAGGSDGTFSDYLRNALITELKTAGRFDQQSQMRIEGVLANNALDAGAATGSATVAAHFVVTKASVNIYDKTLTVTHTWDSSFMGAIAIPSAVQNYAGAIQKLVFKLVTDPDFVRVTTTTKGV